MRRLHREELSAFCRELKYLASGVTEDLSDDQAEARFQRLPTVMEQMRPRGGTWQRRDLGAGSGRGRLLEVRRHLEITTEQLTTEQLTTAGISVSTHTGLEPGAAHDRPNRRLFDPEP